MTGSVFDLIKHLCKTSDVTYKTIRSSAFYVLYLLYYIHSKNTGALKLHTRQSWKWKLEMGWKLKSSTFWWVHSNSKQTLTCSRIFWAVYKHYSLFSLETEVPVWKPNMQLFTVFSLNTVHTWNFVNSLLNFFIYSFISFFSYSENSMHHLKWLHIKKKRSLITRSANRFTIVWMSVSRDFKCSIMLTLFKWCSPVPVWVLNPSEGFKPLTGEMNKSWYNVLLEKHGRCYLRDCYFIMYCSPVVGEISTWSVAEFVSLLTYKELKSLLFLL